MYHRQDGFSLIEIILVLVVLGGLVVSGLLVFKHKGQAPNQSSGRPHTFTSTSSSAAAMNGVALGIDTPTENDINAINEIGRTPAIIDDFVSWKTNNSYTTFPKDFVDSTIKLNSMPMITWQPSQDITGDKTTSVLTAISNGTQDSYIKSWADAVKAEKHVVYIRLMHEMTGSWYPWGYGVNGNTPAMYVAAFQHVVKIFQQAQANNAQFVWCVATSTANSSSSNVNGDFSSFFPGDSYIAWAAMDGYSRNPAKPKTFTDIFSSTYNTLTRISKRPVMIPETATVEVPNNPSAKANWITDSFLQTLPTQFPNVKAVLYFDSKGNGYTYQIDTSQTTLNAIKKIFADPYYQATAPSTILSY